MEMNINELNAKIQECRDQINSSLAKKAELDRRIKETTANLSEKEAEVTRAERDLREAIILSEEAETEARVLLSLAREKRQEVNERLEVLTSERDRLNSSVPWLGAQNALGLFQKRLWLAVQKAEEDKVRDLIQKYLRRIHAAGVLCTEEKASNMTGTLSSFLWSITPSELELKDLQLALASDYGITTQR